MRYFLCLLVYSFILLKLYSKVGMYGGVYFQDNTLKKPVVYWIYGRFPPNPLSSKPHKPYIPSKRKK